MTRRGLALLATLVLAAPAADAQLRPLELRQAAPIRVQSGGNELVAVPQAPVAYTTLDELVMDVARSNESRAAPIRVVRAEPRQTIDYVLCVTKTGTLALGKRVYTFDEGLRRFVFTRGELARSYQSLPDSGGWLWLVEMPLSREVMVTLELRAPAHWPVEAVAVTAARVP